MERKRFNELKEGDYIFCANKFGVYRRSRVYKVDNFDHITKVWHDWYGGPQSLNGAHSCQDCGGFLRYVATTKDELCLIMRNGIKDLDRLIEQIEDARNEISDNIFTLSGLSEDEIEIDSNGNNK